MNFKPIKTQIASGAYEPVCFLKPLAKSRTTDRMNGSNPYFSRVSSEPTPAGPISANAAVHPDNSSLPASLEDWLVCKEALEIRQRGRHPAEAGSDVWALTTRPVTRRLILSKAVSYERKGSGRG